MKKNPLLIVALPLVILLGTRAARADDGPMIGHRILSQMGAEGRFVDPDHELQQKYTKLFRTLDADEDWTLSIAELTGRRAPADQRISVNRFKAADTDCDGLLSWDEYKEHLIIHDEAVAIFSRLDGDRDARVSSAEFMAGSRIEDPQVAKRVFARFDAGKDGLLELGEVLPIWDTWARRETPPVAARLVVKQKTYVLPPEYQTEEFRKRIENEMDSEKLPPSPKVDLILELTNIGSAPLFVSPGGSIEEAVVVVRGAGLVRPENLQGGGGSGSASTPQPVIYPGKTFRVGVRSLNPEGSGFDNVYWTKPGEYSISASFPVYQNLPPHLPQLFPNQPQPTGKRKRFMVTSPTVTVVVSAKGAPGK